MKLLLFCIVISSCLTAHAQDLSGAFKTKTKDTNHLWLFKDGYGSHIVFKDNEYIGTKGGPFLFEDKVLVIKTEYNDRFPDSVGTTIEIPAELNGQFLVLNDVKYEKSPHKLQDLDGVWRITGRQSEDKMNPIPRSDRKTIKILVDGFFQWIAINPTVKGFYGSGGGRYDFEGTDYTEHIDFFSRDNSRVGSQLKFKGLLKQEDWHHSGNSSKGQPIYEIWSKEKSL